MANKISVLLSMSMTLMVDCQINQIRHVQEGDEYKIIQDSRAYEQTFFPFAQRMFPFSNLNPFPFYPVRLDILRFRAKAMPQIKRKQPGVLPNEHPLKANRVKGRKFFNNCFLGKESRQEKSVQTLCNEIPKEKLQNCYREDGDDRSFHDFWSEDIEKMRNVSFNHPDYVGNVLLVVNLASF